MAYLLDHLLTQNAESKPYATAVACGQESMTYGDLEDSSNCFANTLIESGVKPGDRVGIHLPKSLAAIISVYGILKTGACYVPVHTGSPARRVAEIANQCGMGCLITCRAAAEKVGSFP